jgi:hypothetical protein
MCVCVCVCVWCIVCSHEGSACQPDARPSSCVSCASSYAQCASCTASPAPSRSLRNRGICSKHSRRMEIFFVPRHSDKTWRHFFVPNIQDRHSNNTWNGAVLDIRGRVRISAESGLPSNICMNMSGCKSSTRSKSSRDRDKSCAAPDAEKQTGKICGATLVRLSKTTARRS